MGRLTRILLRMKKKGVKNTCICGIVNYDILYYNRFKNHQFHNNRERFCN